MSREPSRLELLQGTLDLLVLRTLLRAPAHGHAIAKHIRTTSDDLLQVETGSLYPALHRLEMRGLVSASWQLSDRGKRARYYRLTSAGRKALTEELNKWDNLTRAMGLVLRAADSEQT